MPLQCSPNRNHEVPTNQRPLFYHVIKHRRSSDFCPTFVIKPQDDKNITSFYEDLFLILKIWKTRPIVSSIILLILC